MVSQYFIEQKSKPQGFNSKTATNTHWTEVFKRWVSKVSVQTENIPNRCVNPTGKYPTGHFKQPDNTGADNNTERKTQTVRDWKQVSTKQYRCANNHGGGTAVHGSSGTKRRITELAHLIFNELNMCKSHSKNVTWCKNILQDYSTFNIMIWPLSMTNTTTLKGKWNALYQNEWIGSPHLGRQNRQAMIHRAYSLMPYHTLKEWVNELPLSDNDAQGFLTLIRIDS